MSIPNKPFLSCTSMKPILFSRAMIEALLAGRKTMTRRILNPQPSVDWSPFGNISEVHKMINGQFVIKNGLPVVLGYGFCNEDGSEAHVTKFKVDDILWVRETTYIYGKHVKAGISKKGNQKWKFVADKAKKVLYPTDPFPSECIMANRKTPKDTLAYWKRPSIFMPKWACRIYLRVTGVKCEKLQVITHDDAIREGILKIKNEKSELLGWKNYLEDIENEFLTPIGSFRSLWKKINGIDSWSQNPYIFAYAFEIIQNLEIQQQSSSI